jgi:putative FmdB family regulatory protein
MPRYEYECDKCGAGEEISRPIERRHDPMNCVQLGCDGSMVLVPSLGAFALKGGGWTGKGFAQNPSPTQKKFVPRKKGYDMTGDRDL